MISPVWGKPVDRWTCRENHGVTDWIDLTDELSEQPRRMDNIFEEAKEEFLVLYF